MMGTSSKLFARQLTASQADVECAETLLNRDGLIPVEDQAGPPRCIGALASALPTGRLVTRIDADGGAQIA